MNDLNGGNPQRMPMMALALREPATPWSGLRVLHGPSRLFGYSLGDGIIGSGGMSERIHPNDIGVHEAVREQLRRTGSARCAYRIRHAEGRFRWSHEEWLRINDADDDSKPHACILMEGCNKVSKFWMERAGERLRGFVAGCRFNASSVSTGNPPVALPGSNNPDNGLEIRRINESLEQRVRERTEELEASKARLALLVETVPAAIVIHGPDGRILQCNPTARRLLGLTKEEALGKPLSDRAWKFINEDGSVMAMSEFPVAQVLTHRAAFWNRIVGITEKGKPKVWAFVNALPQLGPEGEVTEVIVGFMDITERVAAEAALRHINETLELKIAERTAALLESEKRFRTLSEATFEGVVMSRNGIVQDCNEQLAAILGYRPSEIIGRPVSDFISSEWSEQVSHRITKGGEGAYEHAILRKDGSYRIVETHGRSPEGPQGPRLTAIRDVTERKMSEAALRESEMRFRQLAEVAPDGIAITENGRLVDGNVQLATMLGWELSEMLGRPIWDFVPNHIKEKIANHLREDSSPVYEIQALRKDGSEMPLEITGRTMLWQGMPRRVTIARDLTSTRQAAEQMEVLRSALERNRRMAEISEISAAVVHQLGQPFAAITANVSSLLHLLGQGTLQDDFAEDTLKAVESDLRNVRGIMSHLRALIHPEKARRETTDLNQVVSEVLLVLRAEAEHRKITINFNPARDLPCVSADSVQISQLILNVVCNAFDAMADCPVNRRHVDIMTRLENGEMLALTVRDVGTGIASEIMPRIFDAFFTTKPEGMGVGLRISRTIAEAHGGSLHCENNPDGCGVSFTARLPVSR